MKRRRSLSTSGQTIVEAAITSGAFIAIFFFVAFTVLLGIQKLRSIDTAFSLSRAHTVAKSPTPRVTLQCFGNLAAKSDIVHADSESSAVSQLTFRFLPLVRSATTPLRRTTVWYGQPRISYLDASWPQSPRNPLPASTLAPELAALKARVLANQDRIIDAADDLIAIKDAER
jgi:hypothetical protein